MPRRSVPAAKNPYYSPKWHKISVSLTDEASNARTATITFKDQTNQAVEGPISINFYLSTSATGLTVASATSGALAAGATGAVLEDVTGRNGMLITNASGVGSITVTDTAARTLYLCFRHPDGNVVVSPAIAFA